MNIFPQQSKYKKDENNFIKETSKKLYPPSMQVYGQRFFEDQTSIEYLIELLLVFKSSKSFKLNNQELIKTEDYFPKLSNDIERIEYFPQHGIDLKLFSFFPNSKLETRHKTHYKKYKESWSEMINDIDSDNKDEIIESIQNLFSGLTGVSKNRTWVSHSFLPISQNLLFREIMWKNTDSNDIDDWETASKNFETNKYNFMARGGELLYLQLLNVGNNKTKYLDSGFYNHINSKINLIEELEDGIEYYLTFLDNSVGKIAKFISNSFGENINSLDSLEKSKSSLGWIPADTLQESTLFAWEFNNICSSNMDILQQVEFLKILCSMQVLRTLIFQGIRHLNEKSNINEFNGFAGGFYIIPEGEYSNSKDLKKISINSYNRINEILYRTIRTSLIKENIDCFGKSTIEKSDKNVYKLFRKLAKEINFIIPKNGSDMRFCLNQELIRFLVTVLIEPGKKMRLDKFKTRIFLHYGIALDSEFIRDGLNWTMKSDENFVSIENQNWFEDELQKGGFLISLSDAVSIVKNPYKKRG